jgi:hypothetical protein
MKHLVLSLALLLWGPLSYACSCIGMGTVKQELKRSDMAFKGTVLSKEIISIEDTSVAPAFTIRMAQYRFVILSVYKGSLKHDTLTVTTGLGGGDCGFYFEEGKQYIVYASAESRAGYNTMRTSICRRTTGNITAEEKALKAARIKGRAPLSRRK